MEDHSLEMQVLPPWAIEGLSAHHTRMESQRSHSLDRSLLRLDGLHAVEDAHAGGASIFTNRMLVLKRQRDPSAPIVGPMQVSVGCSQVMLRSQMIHAGTRSHCHSMAAISQDVREDAEKSSQKEARLRSMPTLR